jgi:choloylglycine hydrolase
MRGVPGDSTPPSRFIRILFQKQFASAALQASDGDDYKQWVVVKALTAGTFSYRTVDNPTLMQINFDELDLDNAFEATSQMPNEANYIDVTGQLSLIPVES